MQEFERNVFQNPISFDSSKETGFWIPKEKTTGGLPIYPQTPFNGQRGAIAPLWNHPECQSFLGKGSSLTARRACAAAYGSLRRLLRARGGEPERGRVKRHPQGVPSPPLGRLFLWDVKPVSFWRSKKKWVLKPFSSRSSKNLPPFLLTRQKKWGFENRVS